MQNKKTTKRLPASKAGKIGSGGRQTGNLPLPGLFWGVVVIFNIIMQGLGVKGGVTDGLAVSYDFFCNNTLDKEEA